MGKRAFLLLGMAFCFLSGCSTSKGSRLTRHESFAIVALAREKLGQAYPAMDATAAAAIARPPASFNYYGMAGSYFQYFITWNIATNRFASVYGQGNIRELENARVMLRTLPPR
jgi:hypothetical protein